MYVMVFGGLYALHPMQNMGPRIPNLFQRRGTYDLERQGMTEKSRGLLLDQSGAMQAPVKREEVRERRCAVRQNVQLACCSAV